MKNGIIFCLALLMCSFTLTNCNKSNDDDVQEGDQAHFSVMLDDAPYVADGFYAYAADFDEYINVYGVGDLDGNQAIYVAIPKDVAPGTYTFGPDSAYAIISMDEDNAYSTLLSGGEGQVTIESFDGMNLKGTFEFKAMHFDNPGEVIEATEGEFNVQIRL